MVDKKTICLKFRDFIHNKFETQSDAALHYGVSAAYISAICVGDKSPNSRMLDDIGYTKKRVYVKK